MEIYLEMEYTLLISLRKVMLIVMEMRILQISFMFYCVRCL